MTRLALKKAERSTRDASTPRATCRLEEVCLADRTASRHSPGTCAGSSSSRKVALKSALETTAPAATVEPSSSATPVALPPAVVIPATPVRSLISLPPPPAAAVPVASQKRRKPPSG